MNVFMPMLRLQTAVGSGCSKSHLWFVFLTAGTSHRRHQGGSCARFDATFIALRFLK